MQVTLHNVVVGEVCLLSKNFFSIGTILFVDHELCSQAKHFFLFSKLKLKRCKLTKA